MIDRPAADPVQFLLSIVPVNLDQLVVHQARAGHEDHQDVIPALPDELDVAENSALELRR